MKRFSHSGAFGDIIYSLPTIRQQGGGVLELYNDSPRTKWTMTENKVQRLRTLLIVQDYIEDVIWKPDASSCSLNGFRDHCGYAGNLADAHLATHGLPWHHRAEQWLHVDDPIETYPVVIHRSHRYRNKDFPWKACVDTYQGKIGFIGFPEEHADFCASFGEVPYVECNDYLTMARMILGCRVFVGNQSSPLAVAHGLKHSVVMEICPTHSQKDCVFQRWNCLIGWDEKIEWPTL